MATSIGGLGSGLDTAGLISQLMQAEAAPQSQLRAAKSALTVKAAAWASLGTLMRDLRDRATAIATPDKMVLTSATSNSTGVGVTSTPTAVPGSLTFRVMSLATRSTSASPGFASTGTAVGPGSLVVSTGTAALGATVSSADDAATGRHTVVIRRDAGGVDPEATVDGQVVAFGTDDQGRRTLAVGGAALTFAGAVGDGTAVVGVAGTGADGGTLSELSAELTRTGGPASASLVDTGAGSAPVRLVLTATASGERGRLEITPSSGLAALAGPWDVLTEAKDAVLRIGDAATTTPLEVKRPDNAVRDLMPGVTLDLQKADPAADVTVHVRKNDDAVVGQVKGVVDAFNAVLGWVTTNTKYDVATRKGGPMVGDSAVRGIPSALFSATVTGPADAAAAAPAGATVYADAASVGLSATREGTLRMDETKLRAALQADPEAVNRVVSGLAAAVAGVARAAGEDGGVVKVGTTGTEARGKELQTRIEAWDVRLAAVQQRYQRQFSALDVAMSRLTSQSSWLAGQIKSLPTTA